MKENVGGTCCRPPALPEVPKEALRQTEVIPETKNIRRKGRTVVKEPKITLEMGGG